MIKPREAKREIKRLIEKFEREKAAGDIYDYNEEEAKKGFIEPLLDALGWNTRDRGEVSLEHRASSGRVDYALKIEGIPKIFVEAKPPKKELKDPKLIAQAINYGYNRGDISWVLLTDFEEFRLFDVTVKPTARNLERGLKLDLTYDQYLPRLDDVWLLSRESVEKGEIDRLLLTKPKERIQVNRAFLEDLKSWRERLAKDIYKHNPAISAEVLREATQRLLDRIIFIRSCEDRKITVERQLRDLVSERRDDIGFGFMPVLNGIFDRYNRAFNSDLFSPNPELRKLKIDFKILKEIILQTYDPYLFDVLPVEILGNIYEQYLGYTIRLTDKRVKYELKPEVRKAGGIYYTPEYVVDYIVKNTVRRLLSELKPKQVQKLRILDPACGSGSFLIRAYKELENYYQRVKIEKYEKRKKAREQVFRHQVTVPFSQEEESVDGHRLTIAEKREIVLNHIFGVDIDEQAVEVTRLSLMLKMLEGEMGMVPGRAMLPMLDYNIQCGNSLISGDVLELKKFFGDDWPKTKPFDWDDRFKKFMDGGGFDIVIGNPPWGAGFSLTEKNYLMEKFQEIHMRTPDSFNYFLGTGASVLKSLGMLGMIVPSNFLFQHEYAKSRGFFVDSFWVVQAINLGESVFKATAPSCIVIMCRKDAVKKITNVADLRSLDRGSLATFMKDMVFDRITDKDILSLPDNIIPMNRKAAQIVSGIFGTNPQLLGDFCSEVASGIGTGGDKIFRVEDATARKLSIEKDILHPVLVGRDISAYYTPDNSGHSIIYSTKLVSAETHPKALKYLKQFQAKLSNKRETRKGLIPWWSLHWPRYPGLFSSPKIILRQTADSVYASIDTKGYYCLNSIIIIRPKDIEMTKYLTSLLNSRLLRWIYRDLTQETRRVFAEVKPINLRKLPIHKIDLSDAIEKELHDTLIALVDVMLDLNRKIQKAKGSRRALLQRQIQKTDNEIDQLVYKLYGLTKEEIKVIESSA